MKESLGQIRTRDGKSLSFRKWNGTGDVIIYLHGIESNSGWFSPFASRLNENGFTLYGPDRRGSGLNKENRGDIDDYNIFLDDIKETLRFVKEQNIGKKIYIMGICWGGLLAVNYAAKEKALPDGLILLSPAVYRKTDLSALTKTAAKTCSFIYPKFRFKIPIKDHMFTPNRKYLDFIENDSMRLRTLTCSFFGQILKMEQKFSAINHKISIPVICLLAGEDEIVDNDKVKEWFEIVESKDKTIKVFDDIHHVMPFEYDIDPLIGSITDWIIKRSLSFENQGIKN